MTTCYHSVMAYFESVLHPAAGKAQQQKGKRKSGKTIVPALASPDCINTRSKQEGLRRNPAP